MVRFTFMSGDLQRPHPVAPWIVGLMAAPALYMLGAGPMEYWQVRNSMGSAPQPPQWVRQFFSPAVKVSAQGALSSVMEPYMGWWVRKGAERS